MKDWRNIVHCMQLGEEHLRVLQTFEDYNLALTLLNYIQEKLMCLLQQNLLVEVFDRRLVRRDWYKKSIHLVQTQIQASMVEKY